jgi:3-hydroxyacyl-[acyl-carrier-protein] dehydratase
MTSFFPPDVDPMSDVFPPAILDAIPHRPPMLLVDEVLSQDEKSIHCRKRFRPDEYFVQGHYPGNPIVPGVILCECAAQASAILLSSLVEGTSGVPVLTRIQDARFKRIVRPGEAVEIQATLTDRLANAFFLTAKVTVDGKLAVRLDLACALAEPEA